MATFNSITMLTAIILYQKAPNPLQANDLHTMETVVTSHTFIYIITQGQRLPKNK
jgi:hypothetical protein